MNTNDCATITWTINNIIYCWQKKDEAIVSPKFCIYMPEETKWKLMLFPLGVCSIDGMSLFLYRDEDCKGPEIIKVEYYLSILIPGDNSMIGYPKTYEFRKGKLNGLGSYTDEVRKAEGFMQEGSLIIRCKIIQIDGNLVKMPQIFARTIIGVEKRFFQLPIKNFSSLVPDHNQSFVITSESKEVIMQVNLYLSSNKEENIFFSIHSYDRRMKYSVVKTFIICTLKQEIDSGEFKCWFDDGELFPLTLTKNTLIKSENIYLSNDELTLSFQLTISTGIAFEGIEKTMRGCSPQPLSENWRKCISHDKDDCPCALITELTSLYKDQNLCDMKLKTKTKTFPVHTAILGARSPVFRAMFSSDMQEKVKGCVDLSDFEEETVNRFLLYLYSDQLEDLEWDDVVELYVVADMYAVFSLRDKCSTFLKSRLNVENACETLTLSNLYQNKDLKEITQDFILKNGKVIFDSEEWKFLVKDDIELAMETMRRMWMTSY